MRGPVNICIPFCFAWFNHYEDFLGGLCHSNLRLQCLVNCGTSVCRIYIAFNWKINLKKTLGFQIDLKVSASTAHGLQMHWNSSGHNMILESHMAQSKNSISRQEHKMMWHWYTGASSNEEAHYVQFHVLPLDCRVAKLRNFQWDVLCLKRTDLQCWSI